MTLLSDDTTVCRACTLKHTNHSCMTRATGSSAKHHEGTELCSILNGALREDDPNVTIHAAVFANAINMLLVDSRAPQPWLKKIFQKKFPCVFCLGCCVTAGGGLYAACSMSCVTHDVCPFNCSLRLAHLHLFMIA